MDDHTNHPQPHGVGHETADVNIWAVGKLGIALVVITILSIGLLVGVFQFFNNRDDRGAQTVDPVKLFPAPQVLTNEPQGLADYRKAEEKLLTGYGWVDQQKGVVRIPVDQAIDLLAKRGLPVRQQTAAASTVSMPTESGLGVVQQTSEKSEEETKK